MLANFERRYFENEIKVWQGTYCDLRNMVHWHNEFEMIYMKNGRAQIGVNQTSFVAETGDLVICTGGNVHYINSLEKDTLCDIIIFDGGFLAPVFRGITLKSPHITKGDIQRFNLKAERLFSSVAAELTRQDLFAHELIKAYITDFFVMCIRSLGGGKIPVDSAGRRNLFRDYQELLVYLDEHYRDAEFTECAKRMHFTQQYFSKVFKEVSGTTFTNYLNYVKIEKAVEMIKTADVSVAEVAERCGFNNIRSFNRIFKSITGTTPTRIGSDFTAPNRFYKAQSERAFDATISHSSLVEIRK